MRSDLDLAYSHCEQISRQSGSSFFVAFRLLPRSMYREMCVLYAFMRRTDDLSDDPQVPVPVRIEQLARWQQELGAALHGEFVASRELTALADVAMRRQIPEAYLFEAINGVRSDLQPRTFETFAELEHYCYQVAGVVGLSCLRIWGYEDSEPRESAIACGTAFQLTNILRDLGEDAANGRIYLPADELSRFGYSSEELKAGVRNAAFHDLMKFQVERAWSYYDAAIPLRHRLSPEGRKIYRGLFELYSSLLEQIERADYDVFSRRIRLSFWKKARIAARCLFSWDRVPFGVRSESQMFEHVSH
ncbi:phytoene/squalene synthase family protein [Planctomicrobium sp. SH527]|uniref:phytoene/squalene synthase family protein n=1 Tax=Planctomicrobium sp. SH527 TaxID=3448123 RepID=UPI003F5B1982